jgi:hypothetical protein
MGPLNLTYPIESFAMLVASLIDPFENPAKVLEDAGLDTQSFGAMVDYWESEFRAGDPRLGLRFISAFTAATLALETAQLFFGPPSQPEASRSSPANDDVRPADSIAELFAQARQCLTEAETACSRRLWEWRRASGDEPANRHRPDDRHVTVLFFEDEEEKGGWSAYCPELELLTRASSMELAASQVFSAMRPKARAGAKRSTFSRPWKEARACLTLVPEDVARSEPRVSVSRSDFDLLVHLAYIARKWGQHATG